MRPLSIVCLIAFCIGLGGVVAMRMSTEAMAVVVGVLCGVSASIPVSLLVLFAARQSQRQAQASPPAHPWLTQPGYPGVQPQILVIPGLGGAAPLPQPQGYPVAPGFHDHTRHLDRLPYEIEVSDD